MLLGLQMNQVLFFCPCIEQIKESGETCLHITGMWVAEDLNTANGVSPSLGASPDGLVVCKGVWGTLLVHLVLLASLRFRKGQIAKGGQNSSPNCLGGVAKWHG